MSSRGSRGPPPRPYKVLCVSALHPSASDDVVRDTLYREFKKYGDISVRIVLEPDERVAYVYFRNFDDAADARHSKSRIILFDRPAIVEPVYESASSSRRQRSITPPPPSYARYRSRSPPPMRDHRDHYRDYYDSRGSSSHHHSEPSSHHHSSRGSSHDYYHGSSDHHYHPRGGGYRGRGSDRGRGYHGGGRGGSRYYDSRGGSSSSGDYKKDKFPNYLTHIPPEDDPMATRTLFAGNLELNITEEEIKKIFGRYGRLVDIDIKRPPPGTGNAFAFIRFENLDMANRSKVELSGQFIGKFQCKIGYGKVNATPKVWVGGLGSWCSESLLWKEFDRFGAIKSIEYNKANNWAHVVYEMVDAAQAAVQEMRGFPLGGPEKRLRIDFADVDESVSPGEGSPSLELNIKSRTSGSYSRQPGYDDRQRDSWVDKRSSHSPKGLSRSVEDGFSKDHHGSSDLAGAQTVAEICRKTAKVWDGGLVLKNSLFPTRLHLIDGSRHLSENLCDEDGKNNLKITQRLRLDQSKLDDVTKRMKNSHAHAVYLGIPASMSIEHASPDIQSRPLRNLISYLKQKEAAGVISMNYKDDLGDTQQGVLYCFPPCDYASDLLHRHGCDLVEEGKEDYLLVIVVCGSHA